MSHHQPRRGKTSFDSNMLKHPQINRSFDIPYVAGYSKDAKTIYIDKDLPQHFKYKGKKIAIAPFLVVHEAVEKALIDVAGLSYQDAHAIATHVEITSVFAAGIDPKAYQKFYSRYIKSETTHVVKTPKNLDLTPYRDEEDKNALKLIERAQKRQ